MRDRSPQKSSVFEHPFTLSQAGQQACTASEDDRLQISFSAGIAVYPQDAADLQGLYQAADRALSQVKAAERNLALAEV